MNDSLEFDRYSGLYQDEGDLNDEELNKIRRLAVLFSLQNVSDEDIDFFYKLCRDIIKSTYNQELIKKIEAIMEAFTKKHRVKITQLKQSAKAKKKIVNLKEPVETKKNKIEFDDAFVKK